MYYPGMKSAPRMALRGRDLLSISDFSAAEIELVLETAIRQKRGGSGKPLAGKSAALLFEKPSLRTKVSFDIAMYQLGGHAVYLSPQEVGLGTRESIPDIARTTSRYVDVLIVRTFSHVSIEELAKFATVPVINALTDSEHPCQALADILTIFEHKKKLRGLRIAFVGDGNNIASSLAEVSVALGVHFSIATPRGYTLPNQVVERVKKSARASGASFIEGTSPEKAVENADIVYTDVWTSMGQEKESAKRIKAFKGFQVSSALMAHAKKDALFMHDLPAHRGEEVESDVIDGPQSIVFDQAENRLHIQRALLTLIVGGKKR